MILSFYCYFGLQLGTALSFWDLFSSKMIQKESLSVESNENLDEMKATIEKYKQQYLKSTDLNDVFSKIVEQNKDTGLSLNKKCLVEMFTIETYWDCIYNFDELDENYKVNMALGLTMCQLINNEITIPDQCITMNQELTREFSTDCLKSLFKVPQYWTTYDGYYKFLNFGCTRVTNQYETLKMKELFLNITKSYNNINLQIAKNLDKFTIIEERLMEDLIENFRINFFHNLNEDKTIINKTQDFLLEVLQENENMVVDFYQDLKLQLYNSFVLNQIFLNESIQNVNLSLLRLTNDIFDFNQRMNTKLNSTIHSIEKIENKMESFLSFFQILKKVKTNIFSMVSGVWNNALKLISIIINYFAYFLTSMLFATYTIKWIVNKTKIKLLSFKKKKILKKMLIFISINLISYVLGRSLVYCLCNLFFIINMYKHFFF